MADISKIKLNGNTYSIKDETARANSGISQTDADNRYLKLSGGTMNGDIQMNRKQILSAQKISFAVGAYFTTSVQLGGNRILALAADERTPAYIVAYAQTPSPDDNNQVIANKEYVDTKATVLLKTWTSADVS